MSVRVGRRRGGQLAPRAGVWGLRKCALVSEGRRRQEEEEEEEEGRAG